MKPLLLVAALAACAAVGSGAVSDYAPISPTLLVINQSMEPVRIYDDMGTYMGNVYPGERNCMVFKRESVRNLVFRQMSQVLPGPYFNPFSAEGWSVVIRNTLWIDVDSLRPAEPCR